MVKNLVRLGGILTALGINGYLIYDNFIAVEQGLSVKLGFGGMMAALVGVLVGFGKLNRHIGRKLQAIETAKEINVVGRTSTWYATGLQWVGVVTPIALIGGLFYMVENYFTGAGNTILTMAGVMGIPIVTTFIYNNMQRNETIALEQKKKKEFVKMTADEIESRQVVGYR